MHIKLWILGFVVSTAVFGQWNKLDYSEFEMDVPPKKGSAVYKADYAKLHEYQDSRDNDGADCKLARRQRFPRFDAFFGDSGNQLSEEEVAALKPVLDRVFTFTIKIAGKFKDDFKRERPYNIDRKIIPCAHMPEGATSYPSSHAAAASAGGCVLAKVLPDRAEALEKHALYLGELRMIVGVHHPSDVQAGQTLGQDICKRILREKDFKEELDEVIAELGS